MWGQKGGRSLITGNSPGAWILRILILLFLVAGTILVVQSVLGANARAQGGIASAGNSALGVDPGAKSGAHQNLRSETDAFDAGWKGEKVCELLFENESVRAARCTFAPGVGHERHRHNPHWGYVVEGGAMRISDKAGTVDRVLSSGSSWWSDGVEWHEPVNVGETTAVYVIVEPKGGSGMENPR